MKKLLAIICLSILFSQSAFAALTWGGASSDRVNFGSATTLDDIGATWTFICWVRPTSFVDGTPVFTKGTKFVVTNGTSGNLRVRQSRATANTVHDSNDNFMSAGTWYFIAATYNGAGATNERINLYHGTLTAAPTESTYGAITDGSGAESSDAGFDFVLGNNLAFTAVYNGDMAMVAIYDTEFTAAQVLSHWMFPRHIAGGRLFTHLGFNGTSTQADWTGNGNNGTVTGATQAGHVPIGSPF